MKTIRFVPFRVVISATYKLVNILRLEFFAFVQHFRPLFEIHSFIWFKKFLLIRHVCIQKNSLSQTMRWTHRVAHEIEQKSQLIQIQIWTCMCFIANHHHHRHERTEKFCNKTTPSHHKNKIKIIAKIIELIEFIFSEFDIKFQHF